MLWQSNVESSENKALVRSVFPFAREAISRARFVSDLEPGTRTVASSGWRMGLISSEEFIG